MGRSPIKVLAARQPTSKRGVGCPTCESDAAFLRGSRPRYEQRKRAIQVVDLFAGCGGLTIGLAEAAWRFGLGTQVKLAIDSDTDAVNVYKKNFAKANVHQGLVEDAFNGSLGHKLSSTERRLRRDVGEVDVLVGGPPCQGHSDLNNHTRRDDDRNALYSRMARAAEVLQPSAVLIENVPTVQHDIDNVVDLTIAALLSAGFAVAERIIDLAALGAPQRRRRHVILALRGRTSSADEVLDGLQVRCEKHPERTVRWAIGDLVKVKSDEIFDTPGRASPANMARIQYLFDEDKYDLPNSRRPLCHQSDHSYRSMYGRLAWDQPAQTVTTGFGSMGQGRYVHPARQRTITPHEASRLQMLPDFMDFSPVTKRGALARLIGNTVPAVLGIAIGDKIMPAIAKQRGWSK